MKISKKAFDFTVAQEVTSEAYYKRHYQNPEWPGLSSGPTIGIGYDLGQASRAKIQRDWQGLVPDDMLAVMMSCSGATGAAGKVKTKAVKSKISIPWATAIHVFGQIDVPEWTESVLKFIPAASRLPPTCLGMLFDLAYNRGNSWNNGGERYTEMRAIKALVQAGDYAAVPAQIKKMKRLWPKTAGLLRRCDERIALWNYGLRNETGPAVVATIKPPAAAATPTAPAIPTKLGTDEPAPARAKPPATTATQTTTSIAVAAGGAAVAKGLHDAGTIDSQSAVFIVVAALVVAVTVWYIWHRNRNPK